MTTYQRSPYHAPEPRLPALKTWRQLEQMAAERGLYIGRCSYGRELVANIEPAARASTRYAQLAVPRNEGQTDEERDALLRALVVAGIEAVPRV